MEIENHYDAHLAELKKLSSDFYIGLARGNEPLTYTAKSANDIEHQVEVNAEINNKNDLIDVWIGFDTDFGGRFDKDKGKQYHFSLSNNNEWTLVK